MIKFIILVFLAAIILLLVSLKFFGGSILKHLFMIPFKKKGKVLAKANATVHAVEKAAAPSSWQEDKEDVERANYNWYSVDVTITPTAPTDAFTHWEPSELRLVSLKMTALDIDDDQDDAAIIEEYKVFIDGSFRDDEQGKYAGPQRLALQVGVRPEIEALQFCYYFELFGKVSFAQAAAGGKRLKTA